MRFGISIKGNFMVRKNILLQQLQMRKQNCGWLIMYSSVRAIEDYALLTLWPYVFQIPGTWSVSCMNDMSFYRTRSVAFHIMAIYYFRTLDDKRGWQLLLCHRKQQETNPCGHRQPADHVWCVWPYVLQTPNTKMSFDFTSVTATHMQVECQGPCTKLHDS